MKIKLEQIRDWDVISIEGSMMMTNLRHVPPIFSVLGEKKNAKVALNLKNTQVMDSGALSILVTLKRALTQNQGSLTIVEPSEDIRVLFGIVGFDDDLTIYDTPREFHAAITASPGAAHQ